MVCTAQLFTNLNLSLTEDVPHSVLNFRKFSLVNGMAISQFPETEGETSRGIHAQISENFVKENLFHPAEFARWISKRFD